MTIPQPVELIGSPGSPYTRKMLALLRYRQIPHRMIWGDATTVLQQRGVAVPKLVFLPTFLFQGEAGDLVARSDSTPIIRELEQAFAGRSVLPPDPALAFIDYLLEDFADEWCTKYMFHYRWHPEKDADNAGSLLPLYMDLTVPQANWKQFKDFFSERQIGRLRYVGSNDETALSSMPVTSVCCTPWRAILPSCRFCWDTGPVRETSQCLVSSASWLASILRPGTLPMIFLLGQWPGWT